MVTFRARRLACNSPRAGRTAVVTVPTLLTYFNGFHSNTFDGLMSIKK